MSSDSEDRVSDHGAQVVASIEPTEDVEMRYVKSSGDEHLQTPGTGFAKKRGRVGKREQGSNDSGDNSALSDATGSGANDGRRVDGAVNERLVYEDETETSQGRIPPSYQKPAPVDSDYSADDTDNTNSTESQVEGNSPPKHVAGTEENKSRKRKTPTDGPDSQAMDGSADVPTPKRTKKALNRAYLGLLNQDIHDAASRYLSPSHVNMDERVALPSSQIGMTYWTSSEKETFFEALGRLGRDNTAGIAERIHTKGDIEVRQYMKLLQDALTHRHQQNELDPLSLEDFPAAVEISQECCQALDEVADNIANRQERSEFAAEEAEYGPDWLLYQENRKDLEGKAGDDVSKATGVFRTKEWLSLSEHFFMNAPCPEGNWQSMDGDPPGIWLTALDNFHSLALTLTRRLVTASHYMAATRIRAERGYRSQIRDFVKEKDVRAAAMSLGIAAQKPPLSGCVRRLGLSVYEDPPKPEEDSELGPMSVTDVEDALGIDGPKNGSQLRQQLERIALSSNDSSTSSDSPTESDVELDVEDSGAGAPEDSDSEEEEEVKAEAEEAILHSAIDPPQTKRDRQALHRRIKAERGKERYANGVDMQASYQEELQLWNVLGLQPPESLIDPGPPPPGRKLKLSVDAGYAVGKDWRMKTRVMSEWEAHYSGTN